MKHTADARRAEVCMREAVRASIGSDSALVSPPIPDVINPNKATAAWPILQCGARITFTYSIVPSKA